MIKDTVTRRLRLKALYEGREKQMMVAYDKSVFEQSDLVELTKIEDKFNRARRSWRAFMGYDVVKYDKRIPG